MSKIFVSCSLVVPKSLFARFRVVLLWIVTLFSSITWAESGLLSRSVEVDIPRQAMEAALLEFGRQTNTQVLMDSQTVAKLLSVGVRGQFLLGDALQELLSSTDLVFQVRGANSIMILPGHSHRPSSSVELDGLFATIDESPESEELNSQAIPTDIVLEEEPVPVIPPARDAPERTIEEIIVTATKRESSARDLALTLNVLTGEDMEKASLEDMDDIVDAVPGLSMVTGEADSLVGQSRSITIRGIAASAGQVGTVGVFLDETPFSDSYKPVTAVDLYPFDLGGVEVLKGPVGTLFGGSALNGAMRFLPKKPQFGEWEAKTFAELRAIEQGEAAITYGAALNAPIFDRDDIAARLVWTQRASPGYVDSINQSYMERDANYSDQKSWRGLLGWEISSDLSVEIMHVDQSTYLNGSSLIDPQYEPNLEFDGFPQPNQSTSSYQLTQIKSEWSAFSWADLVIIGSYSDKELDAVFDATYAYGTSDPSESLLGGTLNSKGQPTSQEIRLVSTGDGHWDFLVGVFNYRFNTDLYSEIIAAGSIVPAPGSFPIPVGISPISNFVSDNGVTASQSEEEGVVTEKAIFGEVNWRFLPGWEFNAGIRAFRFSYDITSELAGPLCAQTDPDCIESGGRSIRYLQATESGVSPKFALKWEPNSNLLTYLSLARGFRFGGVNAGFSPEVPESYESDALWNAELGVRADWFGRSLVTDVTAFIIDWRDAQFSTVASNNIDTYTDNVGRVNGRGLDAQLQWMTPIPQLGVTLSAAYADIKTAEDYTSPGGQTTPKGRRWPRAPQWQTTAAINWSQQIGSFDFTAAVSHGYFDTALQSFVQSSNPIIFGYSTYGLQINLTPLVEGSWWPDLNLNVNNVTDKRGLTGVQTPPNGAVYHNYTTPRSYTMRLTWSF